MPQSFQPGSVAASSALSPQKFFLPPGSPPNGNVISEEDGDWWAGIGQLAQNALATVALLTVSIPALASQVANQPQDEAPYVPAVGAFGSFPLAQSSSNVRTVYALDEQTPRLHGQYDEDFWNNPVASIPATQLVPNPWTDEQTPVLYKQPDEDYWINPVASVVASQLVPNPWIDEQTPTLFGQPTEEYWQNPVAPVAYSVPLSFSDDDVIVPQGPPPFQPDEDFWQNPVLPIQAIQIWPNPWTDEQSPLLFGQPDEDFWSPQIPAQLWPAPAQPFTDDDVALTQPVSFEPDEDFWPNAQIAVISTQYPQPLTDQDEIPALHGQFDEDFFLPSPTQIYQFPQPFTYDDVIVAQPPAFVQPEEDFWQNWVQPVQMTFIYPMPWTMDEMQTPFLFPGPTEGGAGQFVVSVGAFGGGGFF